MKGKLVVIEGSDASGKHTQAKLLAKRLRKEGFKAELFSFPRYNAFFGRLVKKYLHGHFGSMQLVPVEFAALLYALDRYDAAPAIEKKLEQGKVVVCDRYSASNIAHQGAKLSGKKQGRFIEWLKCIESRLPQPDLTIFLDVPTLVSGRLMKQRGRKRDLHEKNPAYLKKVRTIYLQLARQRGWAKISCVERGHLLSISQVHGLVWEKVENSFK